MRCDCSPGGVCRRSTRHATHHPLMRGVCLHLWSRCCHHERGRGGNLFPVRQCVPRRIQDSAAAPLSPEQTVLGTRRAQCCPQCHPFTQSTGRNKRPSDDLPPERSRPQPRLGDTVPRLGSPTRAYALRQALDRHGQPRMPKRPSENVLPARRRRGGVAQSSSVPRGQQVAQT